MVFGGDLFLGNSGWSLGWGTQDPSLMVEYSREHWVYVCGSVDCSPWNPEISFSSELEEAMDGEHVVGMALKEATGCRAKWGLDRRPR